MWNGNGDPVTKDMEKVLDGVFVLILTGGTGLQQPQVPETSGKGQSEEDLPWRGVRLGSAWTGGPRSPGPGRVRPQGHSQPFER